MTLKTLRADLLIGEQSYPIGSVVDVDDSFGRRLVACGAAAPAVLVDPPADAPAERADAAPPESADATPRPSRRKAV